MKRIILAVLCCAALIGFPGAAVAQVGSTTDIITGQVRGPQGEPIAGARVEVTSVELQTTRGRNTNDKGQFTLLFPDGGGQYRVVIKAIGFAPYTTSINRQADEDRFVVDAKLSKTMTTLTQVTVRGAQNNGNQTDRPTPGSTERNLTAEQLYRLPVDASDPTAIAGLAPGVVTMGATDSTSSAFSVAGQRTDQNQITLDGMSFGSGGVPQEAVRNTRVVTNTYDVARGQFTGGQVASTTRSGTNTVQGSVGYVANEPNLEFPDTSSSNFNQRYTSNQLSFGLGGPFSQDAAFWFGSASWNGRSQGLQSLLSANDEILYRNNINPDSASRFLGLLNNMGIPSTTLLVPDAQNTDRMTALTREDFALGDLHTLTLRADWNWQRQAAGRMGALTVPSHGGDTRSLGGGILASLSSTFDNGIINEARLYASESNNEQRPFLVMPQGVVRVSSLLADGSLGISNLSFGGNAGLPTDNTTRQLEFTNEMSYLRLGGGGHRPKLGVLLNISTFDQTASTNAFGSFTYNSLADFANNVPTQYTRTLEPARRQGDAVNGAIYLGDTWRKSRAFQMTYGVRAEATRFDGRPAYNPDIQTIFGRRTDDFPSEVHVSPRIGFTWTSNIPATPLRDTTRQGAPGADQPGGQGGGQGGGGRGGFGGGGFGGGGRGGGGFGGMGGGMFAGLSSWIVRGGIGEFRGKAPTGLFTSALGATGLAGTESQLVCIGPATPIPSWTEYLADPNNIPTSCANGINQAGSVYSQIRPNVTTFAPDFGAPRSWRSSLGVQHHLFGRYTGSIDANYSVGTNLYGVSDMNLNPAPQFHLAAEGNRPVYVAMSAIVPSTGALQSLNSRVASQYGSVYNVFSGLQSQTEQMIASINGFNSWGMQVSLSYTWSRSRDQSSFSGGSASSGFTSPTTAGDPNVIEWGTSDLQRQHTIVGTVTWPVSPSVELTGVMRLSSGQPYTPRISGDINGDGARNDRAFIFDPLHTADTSIANGMARLLANAPSRITSCLRSQMGEIAGRNSCTAGWFPSLSGQVNWRPDALGLKRNLMISASFVNPLAGIDLLMHGASHLQGWGQPNRIDSNLLYVTGFDPVSQSFKYQVNERFGDQRTTSQVITQPFQISITARYTIGPDRQREMMLAAQAMARNGRGGRGGDPNAPGGMYAGMVRRYAPNIFKEILDRADSLKLELTAPQKTILKVMADSLATQIDTLSAHLAVRVTKAGNNVEPQAMLAFLRPVLSEAQELGAKSVREAQVILTKEQWAKLPERLRNPSAVFGPGRGGGPPGGGRP
ncbi:MAG: TonB-dependent receptor [Gemmatimonadetes bacterium]|nr:TonB-dependent receptor [Gemmatimonadota bacterium]MBI3504650.1 TonB-dependent receptor [Pseudomonadota bacterium]